MQDATALQIAMRNLLRDRYWLTDCRPLGPVAVKNIRTRMATRNSRDVITDEEVNELLCPEFGFQKEVSADGEFIGWHMPDLALQRGVMLDAREQEREKKRALRAKQTASAAAQPAATRDTAPRHVAPSRTSEVVSGSQLTALVAGDDDF